MQASFGFATDLRRQSAGAASASLMLSHWERLQVGAAPATAYRLASVPGILPSSPDVTAALSPACASFVLQCGP